MLRKLLVVSLLSWASSSLAALDENWASYEPIFNVKAFVQMKDSDKFIDVNKGDKPYEIEVFVVDHNQKLVDKLNADLPLEELKGMSEQQMVRYVSAFSKPFAERNNMLMMHSATGYSLANLLGVDKVPAIVINDNFVLYGLSISDAIKRYEALVK
ncbi:DUF1525 domain-containing protein [Vibrio sp. SCSIO 43155]|uniref:DUF1525 domain-containing protein n=1 Tax=Vibrio sp. SCSIO 43155 TaxID=2819099 RepID=UPI002074CA8B|nr:DUF1525 domain-containing protein [Vibrio sp. SCSIO 43155]USD58513.1 DUF1525 domain-containing protein [Vibrio sp. SCSIO 43155]